MGLILGIALIIWILVKTNKHRWTKVFLLSLLTIKILLISYLVAESGFHCNSYSSAQIIYEKKDDPDNKIIDIIDDEGYDAGKIEVKNIFMNFYVHFRSYQNVLSDGVWFKLSETGDTIEQVSYLNGELIRLDKWVKPTDKYVDYGNNFLYHLKRHDGGTIYVESMLKVDVNHFIIRNKDSLRISLQGGSLNCELGVEKSIMLSDCDYLEFNGVDFVSHNTGVQPLINISNCKRVLFNNCSFSAYRKELVSIDEKCDSIFFDNCIFKDFNKWSIVADNNVFLKAYNIQIEHPYYKKAHNTVLLKGFEVDSTVVNDIYLSFLNNESGKRYYDSNDVLLYVKEDIELGMLNINDWPLSLIIELENSINKYIYDRFSDKSSIANPLITLVGESFFQNINGNKIWMSDDLKPVIKHVSPEYIKLFCDKMIPSPDEKVGGVTYRDVYRQYATCILTLYEAKIWLNKQNVQEEVIWYKKFSTEHDDSFLQMLEDRYSFDSFVNTNVPIDQRIETSFYVGFWIRRTIDGSADSIWDSLIKALREYDDTEVGRINEWYCNK